MRAEFKAHREETRANMAAVAREIMREGRATAVNIGLALAGMIAVGCCSGASAADGYRNRTASFAASFRV